MSILLTHLNDALRPHGWFAEWGSEEDSDFRIALYRAEGGQAHCRFEFDPSDPDDNGPWEDEGAVHGFKAIEDSSVDSALLALCKSCQE